MTVLSEKEIIRKIKNGEIDNFSYIVNKYSSLIYQYIKVKIKKQEDVEDLVQNVFISFYKSISRFDENRPIKPYLYQIVNNELKMFYRKYKPLLPLKEDMIIDEKETVILDKEKLLNNLNRREKEMLIMLSDGYSYKDISSRFNKTLNTVKSIIRRAREKLNTNNIDSK